jgi:toxin ParE1/3/4
MTVYPVVWRSRARSQLLALYDWIAERADAETAIAYVRAIRTHAAGLETFPDRGTPRNDIGPGIRTTVYRRRTTIAYRVLPTMVEVVALVHGGQLLDHAFDE